MPRPGRSGTHADTRDARRAGRRSTSSGETIRPTARAVGVLVLLLTLSSLGVGCEPTVQPVKPSPNDHYSLFGVINPVQDTQWVRVEPLFTQTSGGAPADLGVTVTLENLASGQTWTLRDSLMEVFRGEPQHNFWTTAPIAPDTPYRLVVTNTEGDTTQATTTTPAQAPTFRVVGPIRIPCVNPSRDNVFEVRVGDVEELAGLHVRYFQTHLGNSLSYDFDAYDEVTKEGDVYEALINYHKDLRSTNQTLSRECLVDSAHVVAHGAGPDWPDWAGIHDLTVSDVARPDTFTNVKGGVGMFSGIYTSDTATVDVVRRVNGFPRLKMSTRRFLQHD